MLGENLHKNLGINICDFQENNKEMCESGNAQELLNANGYLHQLINNGFNECMCLLIEEKNNRTH